MRRVVSIIITICIVVCFGACGIGSKSITLPASFGGDRTEDEIISDSKESGFNSCEINEDGSITYTMSAAKQKEMVQNYKEAIDEQIQGFVSGDDKVESYAEIKHSDNYDSFEILVDSSKYGFLDGLYGIMLYSLGAYYQIFNGGDYKTVDVVVKYVDKDTNEEISSGSYREWLSNLSN